MKSDRRALYTKMILKQSFLEIMRDKPINKITVKEVCVKADINRATFYAHFTDVYDMLNTIENELYDVIQNSFERGWETKSLEELLTEVCTDIKKNGEVYNVILSENGDKSFLNRVLNIAYERCMFAWSAKTQSEDITKLEKIYHFFSHGSAAVILSWVQNGMRESPKAIAGFIKEITEKGLGFLERSK